MPDFYRLANSLLTGVRGLYRLPDSIRPPFRRELDFTMQQQMMTEWCWAAAACSISHYYDGNRSVLQPELVAHHFGLDPSEQPDESWNRAAPLINGLRLVGCAPVHHSGQVSFRRVLQQLNNRNPVCVQIRWRDIDGNDSEVRHAVVITACWLDSDDLKFYMVGDPGEGNLDEWSESNLQNAYRAEGDWPGGRWEQTFFVEEP